MNCEEEGKTTPALAMEKHIVNHLGGYHRCSLENPVHLEFASDNLCAMLGFKKAELSDLIGEVYTALMHPDDTSVFDSFAHRLAKREGCESVAYRLIKKDGTIIRVVDTMTSVMGDDGFMRGYSVVCEILDDQLALKPSTPGEKMAVMKVSGGANAKIEQLCGMSKSLLSIEGDEKGLCLMDFVSMVDRDKIHKALLRAYADEYSGMEPCTIVSSKGESFKCDLWVECTFSGDCFDESVFCVKAEIDLDYQRENKEVMSFSKLLFSSFAEDVFEVDRIENSIKYICHSDKGLVDALPNVRMFANDYFERFLERVSSKDRDAVRKFCAQAHVLKLDQGGSSPTKIRFAMTDVQGLDESVVLVMVPVSRAKYFLCLNPDFTAIGSGFCSTAVAAKRNVVIRLFGSFCLLVDGEAVHIRSEKARELLALLVEKRGAYLTTREAIAMLWECEPDDKTRARYRKIASRLMSELRKSGIDYIVESDRGVRRIIPEYIECDYYDYLDGLRDPQGAFLPEYSWSEYVLID